MTISNDLRRIINSCGLSRYEIAKRSGLSQGGLSMFMAGKDVTTRTIDAIAKVLDLKLVMRREPRPKEETSLDKSRRSTNAKGSNRGT